ncbi:hypothetical protein B0A52_06259 [Exophiala mesophila]|uniref:Xylanolytic transcriptional activator regulatory domain-containing protein n=1 Tax=Exophiala mesophila TaxID=212818 RepID=A0A438N335_EXOME|nr:hypothetical protein B0A52_06259 [Exophiala mesophila]
MTSTVKPKKYTPLEPWYGRQHMSKMQPAFQEARSIRHMARHKQKDEEAGGEGLGVIESRKKLWRDKDGKIVSKRPSQVDSSDQPAKKKATQPQNNGFPDQTALHAEPLSPPKSMRSAESFDHMTGQMPELDYHDFAEPLPGPDMFDFLANSSWGIQPMQASLNSQNGMSFEDPFNADTASSFNMPFTTMNNYNWLFDVDNSSQLPINTNQNLSYNSAAQQSSKQESTPYQMSGTTSVNHHLVQDSFNGDSSNLMHPMSSLETGHVFQEASSQGGFQIIPNGMQTMPAASTISPISMPPESDTTSPSNDTSQGYGETSQNDRELMLHSSRLMDQDLHSQSSSFLPPAFVPDIGPRSMPTMDEVSRNQILDLLVKANPRTPDGLEIGRDHPLLTLSAMQNYLDLFFSRFNVAYPLLHQATFDPSQTEPLLLLAVISLGATYSEKSIHRLAVCIHDVLRAQIFQHSAFSAVPELWMLQTILLVECFGKSRAGQKQHDMAHLFHGLLINLIRRSDCQTVRQPVFADGVGDLETKWRKAIDVELRRRLAFLCFLWDTQHAVLFSQSLCMSSFELRTSLPCNQATWEAQSAEEWWKHARKEQEVSYLAVLKAYVNPDSGTPIPPLSALSRLLILHGLMSIQWDMKRRDQTSLGVGSTNPSNAEQPKWQDRLAQSYNAWKADFDTYCMNVSFTLDSPAKKAEFTRFSTSTIAIYHAAHITLNVEILDLQIYAGARHIIGRPVTRADYGRSRRIVKDWAKPGGSTPATKAAWHAAHLLRDGIMNLDNWDVNNAFHYPWCLYLSTLTCWAFHFANASTKVKGPSSSSRSDRASSTAESPGDAASSHDGIVWHAKAEMNALVSSMTSVVPEDLWRVIGRYSTSGLTAVMAKHLSNVRWAVVHEGMKVLRGLVPERSINEYDSFLR